MRVSSAATSASAARYAESYIDDRCRRLLARLTAGGSASSSLLSSVASSGLYAPDRSIASRSMPGRWGDDFTITLRRKARRIFRLGGPYGGRRACRHSRQSFTLHGGSSILRSLTPTLLKRRIRELGLGFIPTLANLFREALKGNNSRSVVGGSDLQPIVVHSHLILDGRKIAEVVTKHQEKAMSGPQTGSTHFDDLIHPMPAGGLNHF
jgi:hypothetical protein